MSVQILDQWNLFSGDCYQKSDVLGTWQRQLAENTSTRGDFAPSGHLAMARDILGEVCFFFNFCGLIMWLAGASFPNQGLNLAPGLGSRALTPGCQESPWGRCCHLGSRSDAAKRPTVHRAAPQQGAFRPQTEGRRARGCGRSQRFMHITDSLWKHPNCCRCHEFTV